MNRALAESSMSRVVVLVRGGLVREVFADEAEVHLIDLDESAFDGGPHQWNVGTFATAPLSALPDAVRAEARQNEAVQTVIDAVVSPSSGANWPR